MIEGCALSACFGVRVLLSTAPSGRETHHMNVQLSIEEPAVGSLDLTNASELLASIG